MINKLEYTDIFEFPHWVWDCPKCKFCFGISLTSTKGNRKYFDVYESCSTFSKEKKEYIIVCSNTAGDYLSGLKFENIIAHALAHQIKWR